MDKVIPANAGVILLEFLGNWLVISYPRECGGDPTVKSEIGIEI